MNKWLKYIALSLTLVSASLLYILAQSKYNAHKIDGVNIDFNSQDTHLLTKNMVDKMLTQNNGTLLNQLNSTINLHDIESSVLENELIKDTEVFLNFDNQLHINIKQKKPIARLKTSDGVKYMDSDGLVMPLSKHHSERVILVSDINTKEDLKDIYKMVKYINRHEFFKKQIIGIKKLGNGDYLLNTRIGFHQILFGKADELDIKFDKLYVFYKKMWNNEKINNYHLINLKYSKQVVCSNTIKHVQS